MLSLGPYKISPTSLKYNAVAGGKIDEYRSLGDRAIDLLLDAGADPNIQDNKGKTPLYLAAAMGHYNNANALLLKGANPNITSRKGKTPQRIATNNLCYHMEELFLTDKQKKLTKDSFFRRSILSWFNCAQYPHKNIEFVLDKYFGEDILKNTLSKVLITSYDIHNNRPFFFKSWKEGNIKLKDALRAATAAPTYFIPKHLKINQKEMVLVDGGVFANNPAACAYASGKRLFPNDDILLLSIGTGRTDRSIEYANSKRFGKIGWIKPLIHVMFSSSLDAVNYQLNQVIADKYIRIQSQLKIASPDMDNITSKNIKSLQQEAKAMIEDNQELIDKFCDVLS